MSLLPPTSTFAEQVEALFAGVRGRGLALGPLDVAVLAEWAHVGAPVEVVARGLRRAAERVRWNGAPGAAPRSLRACRPEVEAEIARWRAHRVGGRPSHTVDGRDGSVSHAADGRALLLAETPVSAAALEPGTQHPRTPALDSARTVVRRLRTLPFPERLSILRAARSTVVQDPAPRDGWRRALHAALDREP